jgi:hypothetical protein
MEKALSFEVVANSTDNHMCGQTVHKLTEFSVHPVSSLIGAIDQGCACTLYLSPLRSA